MLHPRRGCENEPTITAWRLPAAHILHTKMHEHFVGRPRFFLAIARAGTLTAAAAMLSVSQPTVSRRLEAIERNLGARLFRRTRKGYELTAGGAELFDTVARVEEELAEADRGVFGRDQSISGLLRFTSTETFMNGYLGQHV